MKLWKVLLFLGIACVVLSVAQPDEQEPSSEQPSQISQPGLVAQPGSLGGPGFHGGFHGFCPWHCRRHPWSWRCRRFWGCRRFGPWHGMTAEDDQSGLAEMEPALMGNEMEGSDMNDDAAMDKDDMQMEMGKEDDDEDKVDYKRYLFCPWKCRLLGSLMPHRCSKLEGCRRYMKRTRPDKNKPEPESGVEAAETTEQGEKEDLIRRPFPHPHPLPHRRPWCPLFCRTRPFAPHCRRYFGCRYWLHRLGLHHGVAENEAAAEGDQQGDDAGAVEGVQAEGIENQESSEGRMDDDLRKWQFCPWRCRLMGSLMPWRCRRLPACQRHMRKGLKEPLKPGSFPMPGHGVEAENEGQSEAGTEGAEQDVAKDDEGRRDNDDDRDDDKDDDRDDDLRKYKFCPKKCRAMARLGRRMPKRCRRLEACERYLKKRVKHYRERDDDKDKDGVETQAQPQPQTGVDKTRLPAPDIADKIAIKRCPPICRRLPHLGICLRSPFCPRPFCPLFCRRNPFLPRCRIYLGCRRHNLPIVAKAD